MFEGLLQPGHLLVILGIALLVFGPKKLPELGKGLGESIRGFKEALRGDEESRPPQPTTEGRPTAVGSGGSAAANADPRQ